MIITVEISMYPFQQDYRPLISDFIDKLNEVESLRVVTTPTSTMVVGEYRHVMHTITELMEWSYNTHGRVVFVTKFIPDYDPE